MFMPLCLHEYVSWSIASGLPPIVTTYLIPYPLNTCEDIALIQ